MALDGKALIKEEIPDKESYEQTANTANNNRRIKPGNSTKENCRTTPDSPESARAIAPRSPMSPQIHHSSSSLVPPPPIHQHLQRPNRNNSSSPITNGAATTPPPSTAQHQTSTATSLISSASALTAATLSHLEQTRALSKIRKFLGTLVQIGQESYPEASDRIRALVISLASGGITIDEFRIALYEATNLPFRSYVMPFLKSHVPLLQREIAALSRANNQTTLQYVTQNDTVAMEVSHGLNDQLDIFIDNTTSLNSNLNSAAVAAAVINSNGITGGGLVFKRRPSDNIIDHHGCQEWNEYMYPPPTKRHLTNHTATHLGGSLFNSSQPSSLFEYQSNSNNTNQTENFGSILDKSSHRDERDLRTSVSSERGNSASSNRIGGDEEWKNIHTMLNCISAMVDKTKRAITILQQRGLDSQQSPGHNSAYSESTLVEVRRQTEEKVAEFKRNAEEAVNQVKRQAVIEIQRAVAAAENRAADIMAQERLKMEKFFVDMCRHNTVGSDRDIENKSPSISTGSSTCWNCGRKANETCSGCNMARYCGAFCQHKDWEHHHQICGNTRTDTISATAKHPSLVVAAAAAAAAVTRGQIPHSPPPPSTQQQPSSQQQTPRTVDIQSNSNTVIPNGINSGSNTK